MNQDTMDMVAPVVRVLLRYVGGALITYAGVKLDVNDPDFQAVTVLVAGALVSVASEAWYYLARKYGWSK